MIFAINPLQDNDRGPFHMEKVLDVLHQSSSPRDISLRFTSEGTLTCRMPDLLSHAFRAQMETAFPTVHLNLQPEPTKVEGHKSWSRELYLARDVYPAKRHVEFAAQHAEPVDPVGHILASMPRSKEGHVTASIELVVRACSQRRHRQTLRLIQRMAKPYFDNHPIVARLHVAAATSSLWILRALAGIACLLKNPSGASPRSDMSPIAHHGESPLEAAMDKCGKHLFETHLRLSVSGPASAEALARAYLREMSGSFGVFGSPRLASFYPRRANPLRKRGFLLSSEEVATMWHPPTSRVRSERLDRADYRQLEPPSSLPRANRGASVLGRTEFGHVRNAFSLAIQDRRRHLYVSGKTGMGKSTFLLQSFVNDVGDGYGAGVVDPHGDFAEHATTQIPSGRTNDVVLCDSGDRTFPVAFNPLACHWPDQRPLVASGVLSAFKKLFGESWGPRMENILRNALLALLETPGTSLVHLVRLLQDDNYRRSVVGRLTDPAVRAFWLDEFAKWNDRYRTEAVAPVLNKLGFFVSNPILRNILGQSESRVNLRSIMDSQKILIVNLSKGRIGSDASSLLGALFVSSLQLAAMSRADIPEEERKDFFLYVDEFQNFATDSFATILSEARKYRLSLTIANQYLGQMDESIANAVFGNVGSIISFQLGAGDGEVMSEQFGGVATPDDFMGLPKYTAYARLLIDGMTQRPFSMKTIPPRKYRQDRSEIVRKVSRSRYARPRDQVEADIAKTFAFRDHRSSKNSTARRHGRELAG